MIPFLNIRFTSINLDALKTIPLPIFSLLLAILILFNIYFFYQWYKRFIQVRIIEDTPTSKIRSAAQGYVELYGMLQYYQGKPLFSPCSHLPCIWYFYTIDKFHKGKCIRIEQRISHEMITLVDNTGECIIDPFDAEIKTTLVDTWQGFRRIPKGKPNNVLLRFFSLLGPYRYQEWRMEPGMLLHAMGNFKTFVNDEGTEINILSKQDLDHRHIFALFAQHQKKTLQTLKLEACIWLAAYLGFFMAISGLAIIRLS